MPIEIRPATREEIPALSRAADRSFLNDGHAEDAPHFEALLELDRTRCAFEGSELVGTLGVYSLALAVPGAVLPTAGTTLVSVRTTHRRRGLLRAMLRAHLDDARERDEPLAALWASESGIYERFGYGPAADAWQLEIERDGSAFARPLETRGRVRLIEAEEAAKHLPDLYEAIWRERPGHFARAAHWWEHRRMYDPPWDRSGAGAYRYALYEEDGSARGYLQYRVRNRWEAGGLPRGELRVTELQGVDLEARAALWRHAFDVDLIGKISAWNVARDCELPWLLADRRRAVRSLRDALWLRLVDVGAALEGRRYPARGRVRLGLRDAFMPGNEGTWEIDAAPEGATCRRCDAEPEIELDVADLAAVFLGGHPLRELARAGRVSGSAEAQSRAEALFQWQPAPWCPEVF